MNIPKITKECVKTLFETRFIKLFDLEYEEGKHYFNATRRSKENLVATKSGEDYKTLLPDAVTCIVILEVTDEEPKLLMSKEYRYPAGQFLLSPPAGLIDPEDVNVTDLEVCAKLAPDCHPDNLRNALFQAAIREIKEETGLDICEKDRLQIVNPFLFSSPGLTDESNGLVLAIIRRDDLSKLSQDGAVGSECFDGFTLLTKEEAKKILSAGRDEAGIYYSVYTWAALTYFIADLWK